MAEVEMAVVAWAALVAENMAAVADMVVGEMEVVVLVAVGMAEVETVKGVLGEVV